MNGQIKKSVRGKVGVFGALRLLLCVVTSALWTSAAQAAPEDLTAEERAWLDAKETITFISQSSYPPFEFEDETGAIDGMSVELARWIAAEFGFKATFSTTDFQSAQDAVLEGRADVLTSLFFSDVRDEKFDFTEVFFDVPASIFVRGERFDINTIESLSGKRIAMQRKDYAAEFLESQGIVYTIVEASSFEEAAALVVEGEADALIGDEQIVQYYIHANDWQQDLKVVGAPLYVGRNCMAAREGEEMLVTILNKGLQKARDTGVHQQTTRKWIGEWQPASPTSFLVRRQREILIVLALLLMIIPLIFLWNLYLRRVVATKTADLLEREKWLRTVLDTMNDALIVADPRTGNFIDANKRTCELLRLSEEEVRRLDLHELIDWENAAGGLAGVLERVSGGEPEIVEGRATRENGVSFWCECSMRLAHIRRQDCILVLLRDVSERRNREEELRAREREFQTIAENSPDIIVRFDWEIRHVYINKAIEKVTGIPRENFIGKTHEELGFPLEIYREWKEYQRTVFETGEPLEVEFSSEAGGTTTFFNARIVPEVNEKGDVETVLAIARDVTRMKAAEQELEAIRNDLEVRVAERTRDLQRANDSLRELEQQQKTILNTQTDMAWLKDAEGHFLAVNEAVVKACGLPYDEVIGKTDYDLWPRDLAERYRRDDSTVMQSRRMLRTEEPFQKASDRVVWLETIKLPVIDKDGRVIGTTGVARDITQRKEIEQGLKRSNFDLEEIVRERTVELEKANEGLKREMAERARAEDERRRLEMQVQQTQKLESLGVLAGGIAHDFNNLLMGILGHIDLAQMDIAADTEACAFLREAETAARRAADLCKQMLAYSGRGKFVIEHFNLNRVVEEMGQLLRVPLSAKAELVFRFDRNISPIEGDVTQVRQVVMNLITNAAEAIESDDGVVTVTTGELECDENYLAGTWLDDKLPAGPYVYFEVKDNGKGMEPETLERIFEPFFTTKFTGRGLGLAAVLGIVRGHGGALRIESSPGRGTTFRVLFPSAKKVLRDHGDGNTPRQKRTASGTILLVDDEDTIRSVGRRMLERAGFTVLVACDGFEAIEVVKSSGGEIAAVLLDLTMPRMDGETAFRQMREIIPGLRVLLTSGYSEQEIMARFAGQGHVGFIQKPYKQTELIEKLRVVLEDD